MENNEYEKRLIALEEKFSHQDHLLTELNAIVTKQEFIIDELVKHVNHLIASSTQEATEQMTLENLKDYKPPHY